MIFGKKEKKAEKKKPAKEKVTEESTEYSIRGGKVEGVSIFMKVKMQTRQYESTEIGYSLSVKRNGSSDVKTLVEDATAVVYGMVGKQVKAVRSKYPIG